MAQPYTTIAGLVRRRAKASGPYQSGGGGGVAEAMALAALKTVAITALGARIELDELVEMLGSEYRAARDRTSISAGLQRQIH